VLPSARPITIREASVVMARFITGLSTWISQTRRGVPAADASGGKATTSSEVWPPRLPPQAARNRRNIRKKQGFGVVPINL
jgi:hypothetical protein